jgi:hypothetical protein
VTRKLSGVFVRHCVRHFNGRSGTFRFRFCARHRRLRCSTSASHPSIFAAVVCGYATTLELKEILSGVCVCVCVIGIGIESQRAQWQACGELNGCWMLAALCVSTSLSGPNNVDCRMICKHGQKARAAETTRKVPSLEPDTPGQLVVGSWGMNRN